LTTLVKQPSDELLQLIKAAASSLTGFGVLWTSIKAKGKSEGFTEQELQDILRPLLKPQLNKDQIYYLFHKEEKIEQVKTNTRRKFPTDDGKKDTGQTPIPPKETEKPIDPEPPEEPTELELVKIENAQLKDAMHKMEQFTQATKLQTKEVDIVNTVVVRAGLDKIEAAVHNEISSMRNRGWKTVEITMRAV
jgi:hypothetical protein